MTATATAVLLEMERPSKHRKVENCGEESMASMGRKRGLVGALYESNDGQGSASFICCTEYYGVRSIIQYNMHCCAMEQFVGSASPTNEANGRKRTVQSRDINFEDIKRLTGPGFCQAQVLVTFRHIRAVYQLARFPSLRKPSVAPPGDTPWTRSSGTGTGRSNLPTSSCSWHGSHLGMGTSSLPSSHQSRHAHICAGK